ncbi:MAG: ABC transporter permease [Fibrobacteria bacterium]|nr:ABC transporter permease [Fibrobacteria bacterium]
MSKFELLIARRYLWAQRRNLSSGLIAIFSAMGVCIGTWLLIFVLGASNGFEQEVKKQLMNKDAHFELNQYHYTSINRYDTLLTHIEKDKRIVSSAPYIMSQAVFAKKNRFSGGVVFGIHPERSKKVIGLSKQMKWGEYKFDSLPDAKGKLCKGVIMGYALANRLGLNIGDKCLLYVFDEGIGISTGFAPRVKAFVLAGTFESGMYQFDESLAYVSLSAAQEVFRMEDAVTGIHARVDNPLKSGEIAKEIELDLGYPFVAIDWQEKNRTLIKWMDYEKILMGLALGIIIIIAAFNIISSLVMNVNDKRREIGILRAMGATRQSILKIFVLEGFLIGIVGSTVGMLCGLLTCYLQMKFGIIQLPGDVYFVTVLPVVPTVRDVIGVMIITNILCSIATLVPAFKASRLNPVDAIRYE